MYPPPLVQWKRENDSKQRKERSLQKPSLSKTTSPSSPPFVSPFLLLLQLPPPSVCCRSSSLFSFFSSFPRFCLCLSLSCFLYYTGLLCMNSRAFKPPDLNTGLDHTTWQKKGGRTSVNHFMHCAIKWRRPWI